MSKTVTYADFDLHHVKTDGKKVEVVYFDRSKPNFEERPRCFEHPHPDLIEAIKDNVGREMMANSLCLLEGWDFAREHNRKNDEVLAIARRKYNEEILRCEVLEVFYTGEDETAGLKFKGIITCEGAKVKLETPQFVFIECENEGLKESAEAYAEKIKKEVWAYMFKNKKSQQELPLDSEDEGGSKPKGGLNVA